MTILPLIFSAVTVLAPKEGSVVPTLKDGQKAYLAGARAERFVRMDNAADRAKLFRMGAAQKPLKLAWSGETNAVYSLTISAEDGDEEAYTLTNRTEVYVTNLSLSRRYRWMVRDEGSGEFAAGTFVTEDIAPRLLRAGGVGNFRDLGGWRTAEGKRVREDMIFRSAGLRFSSKKTGGFFRQKVKLGERRITEAGIETLRDEFRIKTDLELRTPQETAGMTESILGQDVGWNCISFAAYDLIDNAVRGREPFAKIFRLFTNAANYPILMHCSGGRDRTGTLAFLLNGLLGVSEDDLCRDWEASIFSDPGVSFASDRIQRLLDYLKTFPGKTINERIEAYVKGCGISADEIAAFRSIMLR